MNNKELHQAISFVKSGCRIAGLALIIIGSIKMGLGILIIAEIIGVLEEV